MIAINDNREASAAHLSVGSSRGHSKSLRKDVLTLFVFAALPSDLLMWATIASQDNLMGKRSHQYQKFRPRCIGPDSGDRKTRKIEKCCGRLHHEAMPCH